MSTDASLIPQERIERLILLIRGHKVPLDEDLAELYGVQTKNLNRAVKRHITRFPDDFMFQLTREEFNNLRCQFGTSSSYGGRRYPPYAFTEQVVAMLSSVLNSPRAVAVNIELMRTFVYLRHVLASNEELARKLDELQEQVSTHDRQFQMVFDAIRQLMKPPDDDERDRIGFVKETAAVYQPLTGTGRK